MSNGVNITIEKAVKKFGDSTIIKDLSLKVSKGEFFTLLGPSGCGKTTLLRMIAGFNSIDGGTFKFDEKTINDLDPAKRNIGMVFQNYAIFPHLSVEQNVQFGLKNRRVPKNVLSSKTDEFLKLMQIDQYRDRMPERLSGGQQQRVALARALVIEPDVLLMDEPLSNLDAKLRVEMRTIIKSIQRKVGITTVYVTHDQEEAMAVSDRIAVINKGEIQHIGNPKNIYQRPANVFVATFIGRTNMLKGKLSIQNNHVLITIDEYTTELNTVSPEYMRDQNVLISVRPEEFILSRDKNVDGIQGVVRDAVFLGLNTHYYVDLLSGESVEIIQESSIEDTLEKGAEISLSINTDKINVFTEDGQKNILKGVINDLNK